jgi:NAD(P)-dependent dehydrogenase (short-subunit alcohol dehydrogenase family)
MDGLTGKVIIVAGGAAGIGAATARRLARAGALVIVADINAHLAALTAESIEASGGVARSYGFDITDADSIDRLVTYAATEFGGLDGLHNNVADLRVETFGADTNILDIDLDVWRRTFEINLTGFLLTMRRAIPELLKRGGGSIVNTSSGAAFLGEPIRPAYSASKAGVNALTRHVAAAYGRAGIRCNSIAPGSIATEQAKILLTELVGNSEDRFKEVREKYLRSHRDGKAEDVASMVALLMSEEGSWINGQCINVDGGRVFR